MRDIGKNIRDLRSAKNMTQDTLAEKLFVTRQTVSNYETGRTRPDVEMVVRIAEVLETDANTILYGIPTPPERKADVIKLIIAACGVLVLFPLYLWAVNWAYQYRSMTYIGWPNLLLRIFAAPIPFSLLGWTLMQALGTFTKLTPVKNMWIPWALRGMILFYLAVMLAFTVGIFAEFRLPSLWERLVYGLLGALPGVSLPLARELLCFLLGSLLWLFRQPEQTPQNN